MLGNASLGSFNICSTVQMYFNVDPRDLFVVPFRRPVSRTERDFTLGFYTIGVPLLNIVPYLHEG